MSTLDISSLESKVITEALFCYFATGCTETGRLCDTLEKIMDTAKIILSNPRYYDMRTLGYMVIEAIHFINVELWEMLIESVPLQILKKVRFVEPWDEITYQGQDFHSAQSIANTIIDTIPDFGWGEYINFAWDEEAIVTISERINLDKFQLATSANMVSKLVFRVPRLGLTCNIPTNHDFIKVTPSLETARISITNHNHSLLLWLAILAKCSQFYSWDELSESVYQKLSVLPKFEFAYLLDHHSEKLEFRTEFITLVTHLLSQEGILIVPFHGKKLLYSKTEINDHFVSGRDGYRREHVILQSDDFWVVCPTELMHHQLPKITPYKKSARHRAS